MPIDPKWLDAAADAVLAMEQAYGECADIVGSHEGDDAGHVEVQWPDPKDDLTGSRYMHICCPIGQEAEHAAFLDAEVRERRHPGVMRRCGNCANRAKSEHGSHICLKINRRGRCGMGETTGNEEFRDDGPPWDCRWWKER